MATLTDLAVEIAGDIKGLRAGRYERGDLPEGADLNDYQDTAHWTASRNSLVATIANWPPQLEGVPGHVEVMGAPNGLTIQRVTGRGSGHMIVQRYVNSVASQTWSAWEKVWPTESADGWDKGDIPSGQDMNILHTPGMYGVRSNTVAASIVNAPDDARSGVVEVLATSNGIYVQRWTYNADGYQGVRYRTTNGISAGTWTAWTTLGGSGAGESWDRGDIPTGQDMDTLTEPGFYGAGKTALVASLVNAPADAAPGTVEVLTTSNGITVQRWIYYGAGYGERVRTTLSVTSGSWTAWLDPRAGGGAPSPSEPGTSVYAPHAIREAQFMQAMGGPIDTQGRAAVAFRMDHGFANFATELLPLFRARGIVPSMVYNPRNWGRPENTGVTAADLNSWVAAGEVEVWNHGADHSDVSSDEDLYDQIVNSLAEIEAELPAAVGKVWGFAPPGVNGTTGYGGYGSGSTPEKWDTTAGRLILKHHAVAAAYLPGTGTRPLDGQIRQGLSHHTMDNYSVAEIISRIDTAIATRRGAQLMIHPSLLNTAGRMTTADVEEILDYVVAKRDAGQLVTLSPYQMLVADSTRSTEYDSGLRNITAGIVDTPASGGIYIRRQGNVITYSVDELLYESAASMVSLGNIPVGFRPSGRDVEFASSRRQAADTNVGIRVTAGGNLWAYRAEAGQAFRGSTTWITTDPIPAPSALPGGPA